MQEVKGLFELTAPNPGLRGIKAEIQEWTLKADLLAIS